MLNHGKSRRALCWPLAVNHGFFVDLTHVIERPNFHIVPIKIAAEYGECRRNIMHFLPEAQQRPYPFYGKNLGVCIC